MQKDNGALEFILENFADQPEHIRRIVACLKYCQGKTTELLEAAVEYNNAPYNAYWEPPHPIFSMADDIDRLCAHREKLRVVLKNLIELVDIRMPESSQWPDVENARALIAATP